MISLIWAMDKNRVIGSNNQLPWHLPEDLKYFKRVTMGCPIVMGRKTFDSIGRVLPGRENVIMTRDIDYVKEGCKIVHSLDELLQYSKGKKEEVFVIGGAEIFKETLPFADKLYITVIQHEFPGDTFFPSFSLNEWELVSSEAGLKNEQNPYDYDFLVYRRKN